LLSGLVGAVQLLQVRHVLGVVRVELRVALGAPEAAARVRLLGQRVPGLLVELVRLPGLGHQGAHVVPALPVLREVVELLLHHGARGHAVHVRVRDGRGVRQLRDLQVLGEDVLVGRLVEHVVHPPVPVGVDHRGVGVLDVGVLHPPVLPEGEVQVLVVLVAVDVAALERAVLGLAGEVHLREQPLPAALLDQAPGLEEGAEQQHLVDRHRGLDGGHQPAATEAAAALQQADGLGAQCVQHCLLIIY
jgi:hypothetical protein